MRWFRALAALATVTALPACWSLAVEVPTLSDGTGDGGPTPPGPDASLDGEAGEAGETGAPGDGAPGDAPFEAAEPFCVRRLQQPNLILCDDFDDGGLGAKWSGGLVTGDGGTLTFQNGGVDGTPRSIKVTAPAPCAASFAQLVDERDAAPSRIQLEARVRIVAAPTTSAVHVVGTQIVLTDAGYYRLDLAWETDHFTVIENNAGSTTPHNTKKLTLDGGYMHVETSFDIDAGNIQVKVDDETLIDEGINAPGTAAKSTRIELGVYADNCNSVTEFHVDDVAYAVVPR